jgi:RecA-family ATPase
LAVQQGCAVLLLSHPSLSGLASGSGTSGSTAWNNSVRSRLYLERINGGGQEPDPDKRLLRTMKANYGRAGGEIKLTWKDGVFVRETPASKAAANAKAEKVFLEILDDLTAQGRYVSANPSSTYAPSQFAKHPKAKGMAKKALAGAMEALLGRGAIVRATHGSGAKARRHLARKEVQHVD